MQTAAKQNYRGSVAFYDTWPLNEFGLFYNGSEPTWDSGVLWNDNVVQHTSDHSQTTDCNLDFKTNYVVIKICYLTRWLCYAEVKRDMKQRITVKPVHKKQQETEYFTATYRVTMSALAFCTAILSGSCINATQIP